MTHHHVDRFHSAVQVLAGDGNVKQRLLKAFEGNLDAISEDELPGRLQGRFSELRTLMTREKPLNGEGPVCASVRKMSAKEASTCAVSLVSMYSEILRHSRNEESAVPAEPDARQMTEAPPPFLVKSAF
jgi:hypothetical protein